jgi:hypothetical protein
MTNSINSEFRRITSKFKAGMLVITDVEDVEFNTRTCLNAFNKEMDQLISQDLAGKTNNDYVLQKQRILVQRY